MMTREKLEAAIGAAEAVATPLARESIDHGPKHWQDVAYLGLLAIRLGVPANADFVVLFGAIHDTQRLSETKDPDHGARAAEVVVTLAREGLVEGGQLTPLSLAIATHTIAGVAPLDPSMAACFDADRVTLPRVGYEVDRARLSSTEWIPESKLYRLIEEGEVRATAEEPVGWERVLDLWERADSPLRAV
jgi:uncharacterized protein